jgi:SAM-dependent methyltransferase
VRAHEAGIDNVTLVVTDVQTIATDDRRLDAVFSRFGVMFFHDPAVAFRNVRRSVAPHGRLGFVCWQPLRRNAWARIGLEAVAEHLPLPDLPPPGTPGPFSLSDPEHLRSLLGESGWLDVDIVSHEVQMAMGGSRKTEDAATLMTQIGPAARALRAAGNDADLLKRIRESLLARLGPLEGPSGLLLGGAAWIVTARAAG